ncbi:MATE family efflux transporter [Undibacterium fentianense]|uniref:MATE family efflux transporter n=1 Tax=Undibacterium fentianense TaxID=2828728 RepID=A0A941DXT6_9BURK|nr:MATE family efflux transporter [Undibacterium fentianense]MBR7798715.1 MATE family efflux transporter [Undibacterium fentianense]
MRDLTQGSISNHILVMAAPIGIGMLVQTLYFFVDLYFVAGLGDAALAGVSSAGIVNFIVMALTQMLSVGAVTLISHAVGRKDQAEANLVFNQTIVLSTICGVFTLVAGYLLGPIYMKSLGADDATILAGNTFIKWLIPGLALQFALAAAGGALRGTGVVKPAMVGQMLTVLVNIILAPILIAGWGTGYAMGIAGAGLATSIASAVGVVIMLVYFAKLEHYVRYCSDSLRPNLAIWKRMLNVGLPAGAEFLFMFVFMAVIYSIIRDFGAAAQAGFGLGSRVMQAIFLPVMAISFAIAPIAGQNFGAKLPSRVRNTVWTAIYIESGLMASLTILCQIEPRWLIHFFTNDEQVITVGAQFLQVISWNFVASGIIFACSGMFQALGNTWPSLISMGTRVVSFVFPALWLSHRPDFEIVQVWYLSVATVTLQAFISLYLLRRQLSQRLATMELTV